MSFARTAALIFAAVVSSVVHSARAQGSFIFLQTGQGIPLVTEQIPLAPADAPVQSLSFLFGFTTEEQIASGQFLDSVTVSLSDETSTIFLPLVTVDVSTVFWLPGGEGTLPFDESNLLHEEADYPSGAPSLTVRWAWRVEVEVPSALRGVPLYLYLDLFDNGNSSASAAWLDDIFVVPVPEPATGTLVALGLFCFFISKGRPKV